MACKRNNRRIKMCFNVAAWKNAYAYDTWIRRRSLHPRKNWVGKNRPRPYENCYDSLFFRAMVMQNIFTMFYFSYWDLDIENEGLDRGKSVAYSVFETYPQSYKAVYSATSKGYFLYISLMSSNNSSTIWLLDVTILCKPIVHSCSGERLCYEWLTHASCHCVFEV